MEHLWVNGVSLRVAVTGPTDAPAIIFSNSLAADLTMWDAQAADLDRDFSVVRMDTRGHGGSAASEDDYTLDLLAMDVLAVMDRLHIGRAHFVGLSLGGMIGQVLGAKAGDRFDSLTLCATFAEAPRQMWADRVEAVRDKGVAPMVTGTLERWFTPAFRKSHPDVMAATALMIEGTSVAGYAGCAAAIRDMNLTGVPEQIRTPTLVLAAADDPSAPPAAMKALHARIAGARFAELADAAHVFTLEKPAETTAILRAFLRETQSAPV